jgi:hypothetical protein
MPAAFCCCHRPGSFGVHMPKQESNAIYLLFSPFYNFIVFFTLPKFFNEKLLTSGE